MPNNITATDRAAAHAAGYSVYSFVDELGSSILPILSGDLPNFSMPVESFTPTASTITARYLGRATGKHPLNYVRTITNTPPVTVVSSVGFATSPSFATGVAVTLTCKAVTTISLLGSGGVKVNATSLNYQPLAGEHVWVFHHVTATGTQPACRGTTGDFGFGFIQVRGSQPTAPVVNGTYAMSLSTPTNLTTGQIIQLLATQA